MFLNLYVVCLIHTQKQNNLVEMARMIEEVYGGDIPSDPNKLIKLPGVGRKNS